MESSVGNVADPKGKTKGSTTPRKYWTRAEEDALIVAAKELILDGYKSGNGWRPGFYSQVARRIRAQIPSSDVKGEPHVNSKLTVWKKDYGALSTLFGTSGYGLDGDDYHITVVGTDAWESNIRVNPHLQTMKNKSYPHFEDWKEIFGKDRANGADAHDLGSTVNQIRQQNAAVNKNTGNASRFPNIPLHIPIDENEDTTSGMGNQGESSTSKVPNNRKRKMTIDDEPFVKMFGAYMADSKEAMLNLSKSIKSLKEVDPAVTKVFGELECIPVFTTDERAIAASKIVASPTALALFFSVTNEGKISYIRGILRGTI